MRALSTTTVAWRPGNCVRASTAPSGTPIRAAQAAAVRLTASDSFTICTRAGSADRIRSMTEGSGMAQCCTGYQSGQIALCELRYAGLCREVLGDSDVRLGARGECGQAAGRTVRLAAPFQERIRGHRAGWRRAG